MSYTKVVYDGWMVRYGTRKIGWSFLHMRFRSRHWLLIGIVEWRIEISKRNMDIGCSHNCGLRKTTFLRLQIEQEAWKALQLFKAQIKKQILMSESGKTSLLKMREKSGSRKAIISLMIGEMGLQRMLEGIGRKTQENCFKSSSKWFP